MQQAVNTKAADARTLRFASLDELLAEVDRLIEADRAGTLRHTGNWTLGQTLGHLAGWMDYAFDGYPPRLRPPWFIKVLLNMRRQKYLTASLPRGVRIPGLKGGTMAIDELSTDEGATRLRAAVARLMAECPSQPNPIFGPLTHEQWTQLNLRHGELHLGFQHPG